MRDTGFVWLCAAHLGCLGLCAVNKGTLTVDACDSYSMRHGQGAFQARFIRLYLCKRTYGDRVFFSQPGRRALNPLVTVGGKLKKPRLCFPLIRPSPLCIPNESFLHLPDWDRPRLNVARGIRLKISPLSLQPSLFALVKFRPKAEKWCLLGQHA